MNTLNALDTLNETTLQVTRPIIGILGSRMMYASPSYGDMARGFVNQRYIDAVERNGGNPMLIPFTENVQDLIQLLKLCDGLLIPGGEDIDPSLYGEQPHRNLGALIPEHDRFFKRALLFAYEHKIPVLGVCKGMQMLVATFGGSLYQDIYSQVEGDVLLHTQHDKRDYTVHGVTVEANSYLYGIFNAERLRVNSLHHQSVKTVGDMLRATAFSDDGIIEAIESADGQLIGVQWHPEELIYTETCMNALFADLVARSKLGKE